MSRETSVLFTGDFHVGKRPSRVPEEFDGAQFSPKTIWRNTVDEAIDRNVDAVLVSGDIVDRENRYFEAYGPFEEGISRLADAAIPVSVVSGNHDFDVLPELMEGLEFDAVQLLGSDGTWERTTITRNEEPLVHVDGWSFPDENVLQSPMADYDLPSTSDAPVIGLLHGDLDAPESDYAPVETGELVDTPVDAWLLGHIHSPTVHREADPLIVYPGSLQPLDPGEPGHHGPWVLTLDDAGTIDADQLSLANLRYDRLEVDLTGAEEVTEIPSKVSERVSEHVRSDLETGELELLLARIVLTGRTPVHGTLDERRSSIETDLGFKEGSLPVEVEAIEVETKPEYNIEELAKGDGPAAYIADLLLSLESEDIDEEYDALVGDALKQMEKAHASSAYRDLRRDDAVEPPTQSDAVDVLERQAAVLLDELMSQKEGAT
jgi:DNA repair exonuclease SbcCD nuclease subunit